jgi:RNA polymerase sigma factor (sigma-70 family)
MTDVSTSQLCDWLDRFVAGDRESFGNLLSHVGNRLRAIAYRAQSHPGGNRRSALETDDLLQETQLRLLARCESLATRIREVSPAERLRFFFGCTARIIRDLIAEDSRKSSSRSRIASQAADGTNAAVVYGDDGRPNAVPLDHTNVPDRIQMWAEFHEFMNVLPDPLREVADLFWYHGMTHSEVGEVLGIAEVTSRTRWAQVRHKAIQKFPGSPFAW